MWEGGEKSTSGEAIYQVLRVTLSILTGRIASCLGSDRREGEEEGGGRGRGEGGRGGGGGRK